MYYVYAHVNPITKKIFYIGKGNAKRCYSSFNRNKFWYSTVNKYGFAVIKLAEGLTDEQALEIEKQYIAKYKLRGDGGSLVNLTYGGEGAMLCEDTKRRMSVSHTGMKASEETKERGRVAKLGCKNPNYGKKTWNFGIPRTDVEKQKMSNAKIGIPQSEERKALSLSALEKARIGRKEKSLPVKCLITGTVWKNKWDCINDLKIADSKFKDMVRYDRGIQKLQYIK